MIFSIDFFGLFFILTGFIIGLGAVTVIDLHGFFAQKSSYWTQATIQTHKITKPLIWLGLFFILIGGSLFYRNTPIEGFLLFHIISLIIMVLNGIFLSFKISPLLIMREKNNQSKEILPSPIQRQIMLSFIISFVTWWSNLLLFTYIITQRF